MGVASGKKLARRIDNLEVQLAAVLIVIEPLYELLDEEKRTEVSDQIAKIQKTMRSTA